MKTSTILFLFISISLGSINSVIGQEVWKKNDNVFIKLAQTESSAHASNSHPANIDSTALQLALEAVNIPKSKRKFVPLFSEEQQETLSEHLTAGLKRAKANQDVLFVLEKQKKSLAGLKTEQVFISGRAFYKDEKLNIIIGEYDKPRNRAYEMAYDPTNQGLVTYDFEFGSRDKASRVSYKSLVFGSDHIDIVANNRKDWLAFDLAGIQAAPFITRPTAQLVQYTTQTTNQHNAPRIVAQQPSATPLSAVPQTPVNTHVTPLPSVTKDAKEDLVHRFETLEKLWKKGLISEKEYNEKRKALLSEL